MSDVELTRVAVCARVVSGEFTLLEASVRLGLSYRHTKRLVRRYRRRGAAGLVHGSVGRSSNRSRPLREIRDRTLDLIRKYYGGSEDERFGPTLAAEHLSSEHGLDVCVETLRLWMLEDGLWSRSRKRKPYRQRRERMGHFGELVQVDGSFHRWLEDRGPVGCLVTCIDDSRGVVLARFADGETTWSVAEVLELWLGRHGIPRAIYADRGGVFFPTFTRRAKESGKLPGVSQFGRMCKQLGIRLIAARSPQAKGRVERSHGTHQDRLVKKLRRAGISTYAEANVFLEHYLAEHNERFSVPSREEADFHLPLSSLEENGSLDLSRVFSIHSERTVSLDSVVCYNHRRLQLARSTRTVAGQKVRVEESRDGTIRIFTSGIELKWAEIINTTAPQASVRRRPSDQHPWRYPGHSPQMAEEAKRARLLLEPPQMGTAASTTT
jgi:Integrase core domain.